MMGWLLRRLLAGILVLWAAATLAFFTLAILPGDAIETQLTRSGADQTLIAERRASLGLTDPVGVRYLRFLWQGIRGDLGTSLLSGEPVMD
ncbi:MAG: ABC transporter permease, partial [Anaerolineae bacterium]|nr:ABC transporter permease [Anaerolineae bacterium]